MFKPGDRVWCWTEKMVEERIGVDKLSIHMNPDMRKVYGSEQTIISYCAPRSGFEDDNGALQLKGEKYPYCYSPEIFERVYEVGDKVKIRQWDDMVREFGQKSSDGDSSIAVRCAFTRDMEEYCGKTFTISGAEVLERYGPEYELEGIGWTWTADMFEKDYQENRVSIQEEPISGGRTLIYKWVSK